MNVFRILLLVSLIALALSYVQTGSVFWGLATIVVSVAFVLTLIIVKIMSKIPFSKGIIIFLTIFTVLAIQLDSKVSAVCAGILGLALILNYFKDSINNVISPKTSTLTMGFKRYVEEIESGEWKYSNFFGVSSNQKGFFTKKIHSQPSWAVVGTTGSGKTNTVLGICATEQCVRGDIALQILVDASSKEMGDLKPLFHLDNVVRATGSVKKILIIMEVVYREYLRRGIVFKFVGASDFMKFNTLYPKFIKKYNKMVKKTTFTPEERDWLIEIAKKDILNWHNPQFSKALINFARGEKVTDKELELIRKEKQFHEVAYITMVFEEFHKISKSVELDFFHNKDVPGTVASKLIELGKVGRSFGSQFGLATQSANTTEIPTAIKEFLNVSIAHKVTTQSQASGFDLEEAINIPADKRGRAVTKDDTGVDHLQVPFFQNSGDNGDYTIRHLLERFKTPFKGELFFMGVEDQRALLSQEGLDGAIEHFEVGFILDNAKAVDDDDRVKIIKRILTFFGFSVEPVTEPGFDVKAIATKVETGETYALATIMGSRYGGGENVEFLEKEYKILGCDKGFVVNFGKGRVGERVINNIGGFSIDFEDLKKAGLIESAKGSDAFQALYDSHTLVADEKEGKLNESAKSGLSKDSPKKSFNDAEIDDFLDGLDDD